MNLSRFVIGTAATLTGDHSYIGIEVNSNLLVVGDEGSLVVRTIDGDGIIFTAVWSSPSYSDFVSIEMVNRSLYLKTAVSGGKRLIFFSYY